MYKKIAMWCLCFSLWSSLVSAELLEDSKPNISSPVKIQEQEPGILAPEKPKVEEVVVIKKETAPKILPKTFGVPQEIWNSGFYLIPHAIKDTERFMEQIRKKENDWYLNDMLIMKKPATKESSIYLYHKKTLDRLKPKNPDLASTKEIVITSLDAGDLTDLLYYALREKPTLTEDDLADIVVHSAGMISRSVPKATIHQIVLSGLKSGKSTEFIFQEMLQKTPRRGI